MNNSNFSNFSHGVGIDVNPRAGIYGGVSNQYTSGAITYTDNQRALGNTAGTSQVQGKTKKKFNILGLIGGIASTLGTQQMLRNQQYGNINNRYGYTNQNTNYNPYGANNYNPNNYNYRKKNNNTMLLIGGLLFLMAIIYFATQNK